ncbi:MAG TPA: hypothetical protein VJ753_07785 [Rhizomicrobium sp.]|nr:hypothetical protein [Rhizomicrobium sp.]
MNWGKRADHEYPTWLGFIGIPIFAAIPATIAALINLPLTAIYRINSAPKKIWETRIRIENPPWHDLLGITMFLVEVLAVWALIFWKGGLEIH